MRPLIRTNTLTGYAGLARSVGLDPAAMMAAVGLDMADLDVPDRWIPAAPGAALLELSAEQSGCPDFALRMADLRQLGTLGPLSVVLRDEPDLRSALDLLISYAPAYNEALHVHLREAATTATLEVWLEFGEPAPTDQALDLVMAATVRIIRTLVRSTWEPRAASLTRGAPPDAEPWRRRFGQGLTFAREVTGLVIPARDLEAPLVTADASMRPYTQAFLRMVLAPRVSPEDTEVAVAEAVEFLLPLGRSSIAEVSRHLGISPRNLQRSLAVKRQTFSSIVHATRARLAERYLRNDRYSLTEVSRLLGFDAPSAFSRWFRQQFGTSPSEWRQTAHAASPAQTVREG
jgi:AraC-like DNA-binding protein